jgi:hypothetical protein
MNQCGLLCIKDRLNVPRTLEEKRLFAELKSEFNLNGAGIGGGLFVIKTKIIQDDTYECLKAYPMSRRDLIPINCEARIPHLI